jgi:hypothetical protein
MWELQEPEQNLRKSSTPNMVKILRVLLELERIHKYALDTQVSNKSILRS